MQSMFDWQLERIGSRRARTIFLLGSLADIAKQAIVLRVQSSRNRIGTGMAGMDSVMFERESSPSRIEPMLRDARIAVRNLVRQPSFTVPVICTLGLGVGMAAAMVSVVRGVLLRPLPYPEDDRIVVVRERTERGGLLPASYMNFADWRSESRTFEALAAVSGPRSAVVLGGSEPARVPLMFVSADYFEVAGVAPERGRVLGPEENRPGAPPSVVVSHRFWQESLGGPSQPDDATLTIQNMMGAIETYSVIGVMPPDLALMGTADVWLPLDRAVPWNVRGNHVLAVVGRLAPDATLAAAGSDLDAVQSRINAAYPGETEAVGAGVTALRDEVVGDIRTPVLLLLVGALLLLATSFLNAAGALLARGVMRRRELAVRISLGATRGRLLWQLTLESAFYAVGGLVVGLALAKGLLGLLTAMAPPQIPRLDGLVASWAELAAAGAVLVAVGLLLFGVATAALSTSGDPALRSRSSGATRGATAIWRVLVAAEVALALMLLATAGVLGRSLLGIATADTGFETAGVLAADINLPPRADGELSDIVRYFDVALAELRALPGVVSAGLSNLLPLPQPTNVGGPLRLESGETPDVIAQYRVADAGFFETLDIRLMRGRLFDDRDVEGAAHAVVINQTLADILFPDEDAIGRRFHLDGMDPYRDDWLTVIGVVEEARPWTAAAGTYPVYYVHFRQRPLFLAFTPTDIVIRVRDTALANDLRARLAAIDPDVPVSVGSLDTRLADRTADRRFVLALLAVFALLALALTAAGIWSIVSFVASRRTRDSGIRLALGASPARVSRGLQWETGPAVILGTIGGCLLAGLLTRLVRSQLYGVGVIDPLSLTAVAFTILLTAWLASWVPARRARKVDPVNTLRDY
jgi:predicted permease